MEFESSYTSVAIVEIAQFEAKQAINLPNDFRVFLLKTNGGKPKPHIFEYFRSNRSVHSSIRHFFSLDAASRYSFDKYLKTYKNRVPENLLPIATDYGSNLVCIAIKGENYGRVYFWDHDFEVIDENPDYSNVYLISGSFLSFISNLKDSNEIHDLP